MVEPLDCNSHSTESLNPEETLEFDAMELGHEDKHEDALVDEGEGNGDSSEEASEEEGEYVFQFPGEMDPLAFAVEEDESGMQPYEQFEKIQQHHYESLAANKRGMTSTSGMPAAKRARREEEEIEASFEEIMEGMGCGRGRKSRKNRQQRSGRRKGSKNKTNPELTRKLGEATLSRAAGRNEEAIRLLKEVIRLSPNLSDPYTTLGRIYDSMDDHKKSFNFYLIAAHLSPKDASLWKLLINRSIEKGDKNLANHCLGKAITADPEDIDLRLHRAELFLGLGEYHKAASAYEQISRLAPDNTDALRVATELYIKSGHRERAVCILENYLRNHADNADSSVVVLLVSLLMETNENAKALEHIEHAQQAFCAGEQIPLELTIKAGICHVHLRHLEKAEASFNVLQPENVPTHPQLITEVADSLMNAEQYESALKYYKMLERGWDKCIGYLHLKIGRCYISLDKGSEAIEYYYKAVKELDCDVDARLTLSSLLLKQGRDSEAIKVLSSPEGSESANNTRSDTHNLWWCNGKIKLKLSQIYKSQGSIERYVDAIFPEICETLFLEADKQKVKVRKRLSRAVRSERVKVVDQYQTDTVFQGFRPIASSAYLSKASRTRRLLQKKEEKKAVAVAVGINWESDDSEDDTPKVFRAPPLPDLLKDEWHHQLILDLCKSLLSLERYWEALQIINLSLKLASKTLSVEHKKELQTLGAQIACHICDPALGWVYMRDIVARHPHSVSAWCCCYKIIVRHSRELKSNSCIHNFRRDMRAKYKDSVPPILISGNLFTMFSRHQEAASEYLEAYKLMPDNPLINLCVGTALINLALDMRLQNKHQTALQGLAFLCNNVQLCKGSQESLYNIARAYHHIGINSLAIAYYENVLEIHEKDYPVPLLPYEIVDGADDRRPAGYCDLRREAAYNLHLIYKNSGSYDLARQVLRDHVVL